MNPWILAARPRTLGAAAIPVLTGTALAFAADAFDPFLTLLILAAAVLIQIATNYFNDALDHAKGADTAERLGPTRATSSGLLSARAMMTGGAICLLLATVLFLRHTHHRPGGKGAGPAPQRSRWGDPRPSRPCRRSHREDP